MKKVKLIKVTHLTVKHIKIKKGSNISRYIVYIHSKEIKLTENVNFLLTTVDRVAMKPNKN